MEAVHSLVRLLVKLGLLNKEPNESTYSDKPEQPIRLLSKLNRFDEKDAVQKIAKHLDLEVFDPKNPETKKKLQLEKFKSVLDSQLCWQKKVIPLWEERGRLHVAMANPLDLDALQSVCFPFETKGIQLVALEKDIVNVLRDHLPPSKIQFDTIEASEEDENEKIEIVGALTNEREPSKNQTEAKPIIRLCNKFVSDAHQMGASDIHLQPIDGSLEVRFRIDGIMHSIMEVPGRLQPAVISRFKLLAGMDIADHRRTQDGRFGVKIDGEPLDVRVSCVPTSFGENIVLRLLRNDASDLSFGSLGLSPAQEKSIRSVMASRGRMFLVTGPTGSGKTTTLYTCLNTLRDGTINIETVEDPIEYRVPGVQQIQVNESAGITFASALRTILRQDPDVIMIGEIRDEETAKIALQAAQTGHLVLSTLHTNDAPSSITRLIDLGAPPFMVSSSLAGILAQRLVRTICNNCKTKPGEDYLTEFAEKITRYKLDVEELVIGAGCEECHYTGHRGRIGLYSYLEITDEIGKLIHERASADDIIESALDNGFATLEESALALIKGGKTSFYEVEPYLGFASDRKGNPHQLASIPKKVSELPDEEEIELDPDTTLSETEGKFDLTSPSDGIQRDLVLLIEDDSDIRSILSLLLQKEMYEVIEAENGIDGLQEVYQRRPALVVADLMMPKMDGREFLIKMKNNVKTKDIPVLILTAANSEENEIELLDLGANDFVRKGASSNVFISRVRRALADHQE